ncbi:MAG: hypothetical protein M2R45_01988 [Verrucomicrobia subdivision 3 bacterium]|nr:hypothetical protein [Limisphaerales bacterium]MCS1414806.1 hypothetical protein [Limisphaerales bacterium]
MLRQALTERELVDAYGNQRCANSPLGDDEFEGLRSLAEIVCSSSGI